MRSPTRSLPVGLCTRRPMVLALMLAIGITVMVMAGRGASAAEAMPAREPLPPATVPTPSTRMTPAEDLKAGEQLFLTSCVSCHGVRGVGNIANSGLDGGTAPSLEAAGTASADFMLRTGRMPLAAPAPQAPIKPVAYSDEQIRQLVAYVGSLCDPGTYPCPPIPVVNPDLGNLPTGGELFLANCAPCHNSAAIGGALSDGQHAPSLQQTPALQVGEAIRTGPGVMPKFGHDVFSDEQVDSIVRYVLYLHQPEHPGGASLGYTGPVAEGFVALLIGLGSLIFIIRWITREPVVNRTDSGGDT